jgi:hypothetical protein
VKKNKECYRPFHRWIEVDADYEYTMTVCKKCGCYWDYDDLFWLQRLWFLFDERVFYFRAARLQKKWEKEYGKPF